MLTDKPHKVKRQAKEIVTAIFKGLVIAAVLIGAILILTSVVARAV